MWEIDSVQQIFAFFCTLVAGIALGALYDLLRSVRKVSHASVLRVTVSDILFSSFAAFLCFILELCLTAGQIRFYFIIGIATGFLLERHTVSRFHCRILMFLFRKIHKLQTVLAKVILQQIRRFWLITHSFFVKIVFFLKKVAKSLKKLLKKG